MIQSQLDSKTERLDSIQEIEVLSQKIFKELAAQYPAVNSLSLQPSTEYTDSSNRIVWLVNIKLDSAIRKEDKIRVKAWLKERVQNKILYIQYRVKIKPPIDRIMNLFNQ